jgi:hypothetical protein
MHPLAKDGYLEAHSASIVAVAKDAAIDEIVDRIVEIIGITR